MTATIGLITDEADIGGMNTFDSHKLPNTALVHGLQARSCLSKHDEGGAIILAASPEPEFHSQVS